MTSVQSGHGQSNLKFSFFSLTACDLDIILSVAGHMDFDQITEEYVRAIREHKIAHVEAMRSNDEATNRNYSAACAHVNEAGERWRKAWAERDR
jgi:hypothetical protein